MSNLLKPLYALTVGEYMELNKKIVADAMAALVAKGSHHVIPAKAEDDLIFIDQAAQITGYKKPTLYSKVCRFEIPVLSRHKPLTFSKKALVDWISKGKPSIIDEETDNYLKKKR